MILVAPDSFKGSATSVEVCRYLSEGIVSVIPDADIVQLPLADGGEGSIDVLAMVRNDLQKHTLTVHNPLMQKVQSYYYTDNTRTAYIEMAKASGLTLLSPNQYDCLHSNTFGTGELMKHAINHGCKRIVLLVGGSATNDAGLGMASALGFVFLDENKNTVLPCGRNLSQINTIQYNGNKEINQTEILVATDVNNPLHGQQGAAHIYAPQKGATPEQVALLDSGLEHIAQIFKAYSGVDVQQINGSGAAGGLAAGALALLGARITSGADYMMTATEAYKHISNADILITGEGCFDSQTANHKLISRLSAYATQHHVPTWIVCGYSKADKTILEAMNIQQLFCLADTPDKIAIAIQQAPDLLRRAGVQIGHLLKKREV